MVYVCCIKINITKTTFTLNYFILTYIHKKQAKHLNTVYQTVSYNYEQVYFELC